MLVKQVFDADLLVNNLGIFEIKPFAETSDADWLRLFEVNVLSGVRLARHYLPSMLEKHGGRIIFISSESGQRIPAEMIHYGNDQDRTGVHCARTCRVCRGQRRNGEFHPGGTNGIGGSRKVCRAHGQGTRRDAGRNREAVLRQVRPSSLLKPFETPEEVAAVVAFVASRDAAEGGVVRSIF